MEVLDSAGIRPDLVVGTSIGAILGALYASGYSGRQIDSLVRTLHLADLVGSRPVQMPLSKDQLYPLVRWQTGAHGLELQALASNDAYLDGLLNGILVRGNLEARGNFDSLAIPFRAVATDFSSRQAVVLSSGDLANAVRASYAIPVVFSPVELNGKVLVDGGLAANVPVAIARRAGAKRVIVVTLSEPSPDSLDAGSPIAVATRLVDFLFSQTPDSLGPGDLSILAPVDDVASLDFSRGNIAAAEAAGATAARAALGADACFSHRLSSNRAVTASATGSPARAAHFAGMTVNGDSGAAARDLAGELGLTPGAPIDERSLSNRITQLSRETNYSVVWLWPKGGDSVRFDAVVGRVAAVRGGLGLAYDNDLGGRLWLGVLSAPFSNSRVTIGGVFRAGPLEQGVGVVTRGYGGALDATLKPSTAGDFSNEEIREFNADHLVGTVRTQDVTLVTGVSPDIMGTLTTVIGIEARTWADTSAPWRATAGGVLRVIGVGGAGDPWLQLEGAWTGVYQRASIDALGRSSIGRLSIIPRLEYNWGQNLPLELTTPLGGDDGFAGLPIGDRRGDRVFVGLVGLSYPILGPVEVRAEAMGGASAVGGAALPANGWLGGVRAGFGADTPIGPVRAEYGGSGGGHRAIFIRIGHWF
jgi:NTE family protein